MSQRQQQRGGLPRKLPSAPYFPDDMAVAPPPPQLRQSQQQQQQLLDDGFAGKVPTAPPLSTVSSAAAEVSEVVMQQQQLHGATFPLLASSSSSFSSSIFRIYFQYEIHPRRAEAHSASLLARGGDANPHDLNEILYLLPKAYTINSDGTRGPRAGLDDDNDDGDSSSFITHRRPPHVHEATSVGNFGSLNPLTPDTADRECFEICLHPSVAPSETAAIFFCSLPFARIQGKKFRQKSSLYYYSLLSCRMVQVLSHTSLTTTDEGGEEEEEIEIFPAVQVEVGQGRDKREGPSSKQGFEAEFTIHCIVWRIFQETTAETTESNANSGEWKVSILSKPMGRKDLTPREYDGISRPSYSYLWRKCRQAVPYFAMAPDTPEFQRRQLKLFVRSSPEMVVQQIHGFSFRCRGENLDRSFFRRPDPFFRLFVGGSTKPLLESESVKASVDPVWLEKSVLRQQLLTSSGEMSTELRVEVVDRNGKKHGGFIGETRFDIQELIHAGTMTRDLQNLVRRKSPVSGQFVFDTFVATVREESVKNQQREEAKARLKAMPRFRLIEEVHPGHDQDQCSIM